MAELVDAHKRTVSNIVYRMTRDPDVTEDLTQEVFLRVLRNLGQFRGEARLSTWIHQITRRVCLRELERRQRHGGRVEWDDEAGEWHEQGAQYGEMQAPEAIERVELGEAVGRWTGELPPHYRMVVSLYYVEGRKYREIMEVMGLPMGTVKTYLHRAKQYMRERAVEEGYVA